MGEQNQPVGCGVALMPLFFLCTAVMTIVILAILGPTIGNIFSNVISGLR